MNTLAMMLAKMNSEMRDALGDRCETGGGA